VAESDKFTLDPAVPPERVLPCQTQHQSPDVVGDRWAARPVGVGPVSGDQSTVPGQQRGRRDDPMGLQRAGQQPGQGRQDGPVRPGEARPGHLAAKYCHFVAQDQNLDILSGGAASE
jgi:hypothetical protein